MLLQFNLTILAKASEYAIPNRNMRIILYLFNEVFLTCNCLEIITVLLFLIAANFCFIVLSFSFVY